MWVIDIREPVWKDLTVGINERAFTNNNYALVRIMYAEKGTGERTFPELYRCTKELAFKSPEQVIDGHIKVRRVKIADMEVLCKDE